MMNIKEGGSNSHLLAGTSGIRGVRLKRPDLVQERVRCGHVTSGPL